MALGEIGLVADVGRVSVRFALSGGDAGPVPRAERRYQMAEHPTFTSALVDYLDQVGERDRPMASVLAVAGAVHGDLINLTGSRWYISLAGLEAVLRRPPRAINECAANALALTQLPDNAFLPLPGAPVRPVRAGGSYLVIGPGTGLGIAALITDRDRLVPVQSEAAHMRLAAGPPEQQAFIADLVRRGMVPTNEALLSAPGLLNAYRAVSGGRVAARPEDVTRGTVRDPDAARAMRLFVMALGGLIGDLVLAFGAWDGVFLTGAVMRAIQPQLADPLLREAMGGRTAFRRQLRDLPIAVVGRGDLELAGAAAALNLA